MEKGKIRMLANLIELNKIEVRLSKKYYGGISPKFYLRDLNKETLVEIPVAETCEDDICVKYYFKNVHIDLTHHYEMVDNYGLSAILQYVRLSELDNFDELFYYDGKLGPLYQKEKTTFKVWAPTALEVMVKVGNEAYQMERKEKGVFEVTVQGDLDNQEYNYLIRHHKSFHETLDLYAYASNANSNSNIVIDVDKINEPLYLENLPHMKRKTEAIIYELSVRDFTMSKTINATHPGTFMSLVESGLVTPQGNKAGFDYLVDLGVTHVQIMPMYDFATVDELHPTVMYNWGYDPKFYFAPEGSYSTNPNDCYTRLFELRELVGSFHKNGLRAVMDVVFNHTFNRISNSLEQLCPGYYFRKNNDGTYSNGSGCGNDIESCHYMARKLIIDALVHFVKWYGFDGYRFDLMGILDKETINKAYYTLKNINKDIIMYGEGWNMATNLPSSLKANSNNAKEMPTIGFFNDRFREVVKGASSDNNLASKGYLSGDTNYIDGFKHCILGSCVALAFPPMFDEPTQSINYVECHDNATIFDKLLLSNADESVENRLKRIKMMNVVSILSYGIPFIHAGQEFGATKKSHYNSYNLIDEINGLDYNLRTARKDMVKYLADAIKLRKNMDIFKLDKKEDIVNAVTFENLSHGALLIKYDDKANSRIVYFFINPTTETVSYKFDNYAKIIFNEAGLINTDFFSQLMIINGLSLIVALSNY